MRSVTYEMTFNGIFVGARMRCVCVCFFACAYIDSIISNFFFIHSTLKCHLSNACSQSLLPYQLLFVFRFDFVVLFL